VFFVVGVVAAYFVIFMQSWADAECPARPSVTPAMRWAIALPTLALALYCVGAAGYLRRRTGRPIHLLPWLGLAVAVLATGTWEWANISPSSFCF
jgi:hypothetical protein